MKTQYICFIIGSLCLNSLNVHEGAKGFSFDISLQSSIFYFSIRSSFNPDLKSPIKSENVLLFNYSISNRISWIP